MADRLVTIANFDHLPKASLIKDWFADAGIESYLLDRGVQPESAAFGEGAIELQVFESEVIKALELLEKLNLQHPAEWESSGENLQEIHKILVPVDFSNHSWNAACYALHVAKQKRAQLTLVHVYFNPIMDPLAWDHFYAYPAGLSENLSDILEATRIKMKHLVLRLIQYQKENNLLGIKVNEAIIGGIAEEAVLKFAKAGGFDLLIVGIHKKEKEESLLQSFLNEIIQKAKIPVLAIPEQASYRPTGFKKLMYATNFDPSDGRAIQELIRMTQPIDIHLDVVHVDDTGANPFINYDLAHFKEHYLGKSAVRMDFELIVEKNLSKGIEDFITQKKIDIIAITAQKRGLIDQLLKPSLTKELLHQIQIPLLIFHS